MATEPYIHRQIWLTEYRRIEPIRTAANSRMPIYLEVMDYTLPSDLDIKVYVYNSNSGEYVVDNKGSIGVKPGNIVRYSPATGVLIGGYNSLQFQFPFLSTALVITRQIPVDCDPDFNEGGANNPAAIKNYTQEAQNAAAAAAAAAAEAAAKAAKIPDNLDAALNNKVNVSQGAAYAGKALVINASGNVVPGEAGVQVDTTLTVSGKAADAKAVGDRFVVADGNTDRVAASVDALRQRVSASDNAIFGRTDLLLSWTSGQRSYANGVITEGESKTYAYTNYVPVSAGDTINITSQGKYSFRPVLIDSNTGRYTNVNGSAFGGENPDDRSKVVPDGYTYLYLIAKKADGTPMDVADATAKITMYKSDPKRALSESVAAFSDDVVQTQGIIGDASLLPSTEIERPSYTSGGIVGEIGRPIDLTTYAGSNYNKTVYPVNGGEFLAVTTMQSTALTPFSHYVFATDVNGIVVYRGGAAEGVQQVLTWTVILPQNARYLYVMSRGSNNGYVKVSQLKTVCEALADSGAAGFDNYYMSPALFEDIGVIGDSYASGSSGENAADTAAHMHKNVSWPAMMARRNGISVHNYSKGGLSTRTWLTDSEVGLSVLRADIAAGTKCGLYILALVRNDYNIENRGETGYIGSLADITGHSLGNYPDTFYGNYATIIATIKRDSPQSRLVMMTGDYGSGLGAQYNDAVEAIAAHFQIPCMVQRSDPYFTDRTYYKSRYSGGHPSPYMYSGMELAIERLLGVAVRDNQDYFLFYNGMSGSSGDAVVD